MRLKSLFVIVVLCLFTTACVVTGNVLTDYLKNEFRLFFGIPKEK